jgi:hypothetical protein
MRLLVEVGKKIAEHQTSSSNKELKDRLDSIDQRTKNQEDAQNRARQMEAAAEFLYRQGGTAKYLADEIRTKGEDSHLARTWLGTPGITTDCRAMILNGMGLAAAFDRARENGNGEPVVPQAPAPQVDASYPGLMIGAITFPMHPFGGREILARVFPRRDRRAAECGKGLREIFVARDHDDENHSDNREAAEGIERFESLPGDRSGLFGSEG